MKIYIKNNYLLLSVNLLHTLSVFISMIMIPSILVKEFNVSLLIINISSIILTITLFIGTLTSKEILKRKFNYFVYVRYLYLAQVFFYLLFYFLLDSCILSKYNWILILLKAYEGFLTALITHTMIHLFLTKVYSHKKRIEILGFNNTLYYIFRSAGPIVGASILIYLAKDINLLLVSTIISLIAYLILLKNTKRMTKIHWKEVIQLIKKQEKLIIRNIKVQGLKINKSILLKSDLSKIFYITVFIHNNLRFFYDIYFIIFLTIELKFSYLQSGFIMTLLIGGQSLQYISGIIMSIKNVRESKYITKIILTYIFPIVLFTYLLFLTYKGFNTHLDYIVIAILTVLTGFSRAMFSSFSSFKIFKLIEGDEQNITEYNSMNYIIGDMGNITGYVIGGLLILISYKVTLAYMILIIMFNIIYQSDIFGSKRSA